MGLRKTALVLGGGGMYGAYQAGVWSILEPVFQPDLIIGASIGGLNGWVYAGGCPAQQWVEQWLNLEPASRHRWRWPASFTSGMIDTQAFEEFVQQVHSGWQPRIPFGVVITDLLQLKPFTVMTPEVTWRHLAASCGVFGVMPQYRINGRLTTDGGILGSLPLWAAAHAGATHILGVNLMPRSAPWWLQAGRAALRMVARHVPDLPGNPEVLVIEHATPLGPLNDSIKWSRESSARMIQFGVDDAARVLPALEQWQR